MADEKGKAKDTVISLSSSEEEDEIETEEDDEDEEDNDLSNSRYSIDIDFPCGAAASICFKTGLAHLEQNQLPDSLSCFDQAFLALAKDNSSGDFYGTRLLSLGDSEIAESSRPKSTRAKDEMARLSRHLGSLPAQAKHRKNCIHAAIKQNMDVQNYAYAKQMLELLLSKAPPSKQEELRSLIDICVQRGLTNKSIEEPDMMFVIFVVPNFPHSHLLDALSEVWKVLKDQIRLEGLGQFSLRSAEITYAVSVIHQTLLEPHPCMSDCFSTIARCLGH
ncbi:hypothetical protein F3Y22_tig00110678pilonHSYRG00196 [Hibiscus syriacus]|uniref:Uncharacterized protein n=1 Tax=Hibiscus syriacus TaxID=106335 RepID=A0A6A2ZXR1_HIBSY|nr:hypothetical protein F3Y22_tig00110678pilonHSYRG00196 [Hibiscus syriacus]